MEDLILKEILKKEISKMYETKGVRGCFENIIAPENEARKKAKKRLGDEYNENHFKCGRISAKLSTISNIVGLKQISKNHNDRLELAKLLNEIAEELKNIEDEKVSKIEKGDIVKYIGKEWAKSIVNPCKVMDYNSILKTFICMAKDGSCWFLKEEDLRKVE